IFFSFIASIVVLGVFTPSLLGFAYYYGMNLLISCLIAVFYGSIQLLILSNHLKEIYKEGEKEENVPLNKLSTFLGKTLPWLLFNLSLGFSFFFLFFTGILKFEMDFYSGISLIVISVLFTLFLNIIMLKKTILWIGKKVVSLSYIFSKLSKQTIKLSRRFIKDSYRMIQLLILFLIICTFFLSSFDTINNFNSLNNDLNQVGDVIISFHPEKGDIVNSYLSPYVNISAEVQLLVSEFKTLTEPGPISHYGFIFLINSSKISQIFDSKAFKDKYFGNYIASEISNELIDDCDLVVVNKALAELVSTQQSDAFYIPIPTKNGENNLLRTTVLDIARFVPYFSGISGEKPFSILNSEIITNATELQVKTMHHIIWLKENISKTVFKDNIQTINKNYNTHIEIIDQFEFPIITDYYWVPSVFRQFMLSLLTVFTVCLFFLFLAFYSDTIDKQMKGFRIFFARGLSFKKGIFLSMLPLFLFTLFYIVFSYIAGLILSFVMFSSIQPKYYLRIPFSVFPFSFTFLSAQIILLGAILIVSGITSYLKLRKQIPEVKFNVPSVFQEEEGII
ncbi:MAG: hypothetical protein HGN29_14390, partial [Asgard group archaeon]|nr:hypothetical protein [Asgard group archaeon]